MCAVMVLSQEYRAQLDVFLQKIFDFGVQFADHFQSIRIAIGS